MATIGTVNKIKMTGYDIEWKIPDVFLPPEFAYDNEEDCTTRYSSPVFSFGGATWFLKMLPKGIGIFDPQVILFLKRNSSGPPITVEFSLGIRCLDEQKGQVGRFIYTFKEANEGFGFLRCLFRNQLADNASELMPNGVLTVFCTMKCPELSPVANLEPLCEDYKKVLLEGNGHDLILKIGDKELKAHQDILKARSQVFQSMLSHNMVEKSSSVIVIPDCDLQTMEQFLLYMYCGKVETLDQSNMLQLYYLADKYDMKNLKEQCCDFIKKSLSLTNICDVIQLALNHSDFNLLENAKEYFGSNVLGILRTAEWKCFLKDNHTVANDLLIKYFEKVKH